MSCSVYLPLYTAASICIDIYGNFQILFVRPYALDDYTLNLNTVHNAIDRCCMLLFTDIQEIVAAKTVICSHRGHHDTTFILTFSLSFLSSRISMVISPSYVTSPTPWSDRVTRGRTTSALRRTTWVWHVAALPVGWRDDATCLSARSDFTGMLRR